MVGGHSSAQSYGSSSGPRYGVGAAARAWSMKRFTFIAPRPSIVGALNWSVAGFLNLDIVAVLFGADSILARVIYLMVAVVALVGLSLRFAASDERLQILFGCLCVIAALT